MCLICIRNHDACKSGPHKVTAEETALLEADPMKLVTEMNKDEYHKVVSTMSSYIYSFLCGGLQWGFVASVDKNYHGAGIQAFTHGRHTDYACLGPYIKEWERGAASWHPSVIAHRMRAAHHAYFWLLIWQEALKEVISLASHRSADAILKDVEHHATTLYPPMHPPIHKSYLLDDMKCFTDYEPKAVTDISLKAKVVSGLAKEESEKGISLLCVYFIFDWFSLNRLALHYL